jgi:hypothetical protein
VSVIIPTFNGTYSIANIDHLKCLVVVRTIRFGLAIQRIVPSGRLTSSQDSKARQGMSLSCCRQKIRRSFCKALLLSLLKCLVVVRTIRFGLAIQRIVPSGSMG